MRTYTNDDLLKLQRDEDVRLRMLATHYLCEGYAQGAEFLENVFQGWERWGIEEAFPEFPMLSYVPVPAERVAECCQRAGSMVAGRGLTDPVTRCAGKLMEQVVKLPAADLQIRFEAIEQTASRSKIFFRVDLDALRDRIYLLECDPDALASRLDESIETLAENPSDASASLQGLNALEALRRDHPRYIDLSGVLSNSSPDSGGGSAASFHLTLQSLTQLEEEGLERKIGKHLHDEREGVYVNAVEALVRIGTPEAGLVFFHQFHKAERPAQRWIARGLQRLRAPGLAEAISVLRNSASDPALWLMLLIAETRQVDWQSGERIASELDRLASFSEPLLDALSVYVSAVGRADAKSTVEAAVARYRRRIESAS